MRRPSPQLATERLILRPWTQQDYPAFAQLNGNAQVREFFPKALTSQESDAEADRIQQHFATHGFGFWAVQTHDAPQFIGMVGLWRPGFDAHFTPCVEIGWRLMPHVWGLGYATEAARRVLAYGFTELGLSQVVAMTVPANVRSQRIMQKLGMTHNPADDFDHPKVEPVSPLLRHVLYRIDAPMQRKEDAEKRGHPTLT